MLKKINDNCLLHMRIFLNPFAIMIIVLLNFALGCSKHDQDTAPGSNKTDLIKIEDAITHSNSNFVNLVNNVRGSVGTNGTGSKVIWSKKNDFNLGLFVSANHVYGISSWSTKNESFIDINTVNNGIFLGSKMPPVDGSPFLNNQFIANFGLYHPNIPSSATNTSILPESDFYLGIIDNQRVADNGLANYPSLVQTSTPLQIFDPQNRTLSTQTWAEPNVGEEVIAVGYPQDKTAYPNGAVSTGKIYSNIEAENIILLLNQNNDVEGSIPYNSQVEFFANIHALAGMSGGGVFNADGQLLGIMVRATKLNGKPILRVIKMSYIIQKLNNFYNSLSTSDKNKIMPFISGELN